MKKMMIYGALCFAAVACNPNPEKGERSANTIDYNSTDTKGNSTSNIDTLAPYPKTNESAERRKNPQDLNANRNSNDPDTLYPLARDRGNKNPNQ